MELYSSEANLLKKQVGEWFEQPDYELEASFSKGRKLDQTTFLSVAKRLRSKGYTSLPQEDRLSIITRDHARIDISSFAAIQQYCRDDTLTGKPYTAMIKDRAVTIPNIDIDEYGLRIKTRREIPMGPDDPALKKLLSNWSNVPKAFRMIRRWIFEGDGFRIDMSVVKSTKVQKGGKFLWQRRFRDEDIMMTPPMYEIEVELLRPADDSADKALKRLIKGSGDVLRGIQKNMFLIRNTERKRVLDAYKLLIDPESRDPVMKFRGPYTINLQKSNFSSQREQGQANIRDGYNVTDKADGLRCLGFCNSDGELYLIDMSLNVYKTGLQNPNCRNSLLDGEWVTLDSEKQAMNQYLIFDMFYGIDKLDVSKFPFSPPGPSEEDKMKSRFGQMTAWTTKWNNDGLKMVLPGVNEKTKLQVSKKTFFFARAGDDSIFKAARRILDTARAYYTDGLIFTSNTAPLPSGPAENFYEQFKWKPANDNTIDFLVKFEKGEDKMEDKVTLGENPETRDPLEYKTIRLFVGSSTENAGNIVLNQLELPKKNRFVRGLGIKGEYRPVLFSPKDFPDSMASICNLELFTDPDSGEKYVKTEADEPIQDRTIVEMAYNPKAAPGWRWVPLRIRVDKTERLQSGILGRTLNSDKVADDVWSGIYDPITPYMITTGSMEPSKEEAEELTKGTGGDKYYDRKAPVQDMRLTQPMRNFHNWYIKEKILYNAGLNGPKKILLDMACGVGADMRIWRAKQVAFVLGVDYSSDNIRGNNDSIYRRYLETAVNAGGMDKVPPMIFVVGDSSKNYENGDAAEGNEVDRAILQSVIGRVKPLGAVPPFVEANGKDRLRQKVDCMSCMFALHYFFENTMKFKGFLKNIADNLKVGGYFIGACFDGKIVFDKLRGTTKGDKIVGTDGGATLWSVTKEYDEDELSNGEDSLGLTIDVEFITIGALHREYLVSFDYFVEEMRQIGCEVEETDVFENTYKKAAATAAKSRGEATNYVMLDAVKEFSFLNRWFIFKRTKYVGPLETELSTGMSSLKKSAVAAVAAVAAPVEEGPEEEAKEEEEAAPASLKGGGSLKQKYTQGDLFLFYPDASEKDVLELDEKKETLSAGQWLSPTAPFPIDDPHAKDVTYPTLEHYLNAMKFRVASNTPNIATTLFSKIGKIHQDMLRKRAVETEGDKKSISPERERALMKDEVSEMQKIMRPSSLKKYKSVIDETTWVDKREEVIREGLRQRWETDRRFRKIVEKARDLGKTLLYYTPGAKKTSNLLGGVRKADGSIEGGNMIGKIIMELAGF